MPKSIRWKCWQFSAQASDLNAQASGLYQVLTKNKSLIKYTFVWLNHDIICGHNHFTILAVKRENSLVNAIVKTALWYNDIEHQQPAYNFIFPKKNKDHSRNHYIDFKTIHIQGLKMNLTVSLDFFPMIGKTSRDQLLAISCIFPYILNLTKFTNYKKTHVLILVKNLNCSGEKYIWRLGNCDT